MSQKPKRCCCIPDRIGANDNPSVPFYSLWGEDTIKLLHLIRSHNQGSKKYQIYSSISRTSLFDIKGGESSSQFRWFTRAKIEL